MPGLSQLILLCLISWSAPIKGCSVKDAERTKLAWKNLLMHTDTNIKLKIIREIIAPLKSDSPLAYGVITGSLAADPVARAWGPRYGYMWVMQQLNALVDLMGRKEALERHVRHFVLSHHLSGGERGSAESVVAAFMTVFSGFMRASQVSELVWDACMSNVLERVVRMADTEGAQIIRAQCDVLPESGDPNQPVQGTITFQQPKGGLSTIISGELSGFHTDDGVSFHGFHIHEHGSLSNGCKDTGGHYNPTGRHHGAPDQVIRHVGDLGNVEEDAEGKVHVHMWDLQVALYGERSVIGRAVVIHARADDLGRGGFPDSKTTGHAGARLACCVIRAL